MLSDKLRAGVQGRIFKLIFIIIIISFLFTGIGGYLIPRLNTDPVTIGDYKITAQEWTSQYNQHTQRLQRQYGAAASDLLDNPEVTKNIRNQILEQMVDNVAYNSAVYESKIRIGDEQIKDAIRSNKAFEKDGKFDNNLYLATIRNMGMSPEYYAHTLRMALMASTLSDPILNSSTQVLPFEIDLMTKLVKENRVVDLYSINLDAVTKDVKVTDEEAKAYYDAHNKDFMTHAISQFTYVVLDYKNIAKGIKVTDSEIEEFFNMHSDEYVTPQKRAAYQIVIPNKIKDQDKVISNVEKAIKAKKAFAEIAKENKDIVYSDLGLVTKGELLSSLEDVLFNLSLNSASDAIKDANATTYLYLYDIKESKEASLADMKDKVKGDLIAQKARQLYNDKVQTLSDLTYENPDSLDVAADALSLTVEESGPIQQGNLRALPMPLNQSVLDAAFNEENISSHINSSVITVSDDISVVINVNDFTPSELIPFDKVQKEAISLCQIAKAQDSAKQILETFAKDRQENKDVAFDKNLITETKKDAVIVRGDDSIVDLEFNYSIFAIPSDKIGNFIVANNKNEMTLAILKGFSENKDFNSPTYTDILRTQMMQFNEQRIRAMLYSGARSLNKIEYNKEAIDLVNQEVNNEE